MTTAAESDVDRAALVDEGSERPVVLVGHDRHAAASAALAATIELARWVQGEVHVMHCITLDDYGVDPDTEEFDSECERNRVREREQIMLAMSGTGLRWCYHEGRGDPARALAALANDVAATYIIVGATHPGALHRLAGGDSVAKRLLRLQHRPVLVVPEPA